MYKSIYIWYKLPLCLKGIIFIVNKLKEREYVLNKESIDLKEEWDRESERKGRQWGYFNV